MRRHEQEITVTINLTNTKTGRMATVHPTRHYYVTNLYEGNIRVDSQRSAHLSVSTGRAYRWVSGATD